MYSSVKRELNLGTLFRIDWRPSPIFQRVSNCSDSKQKLYQMVTCRYIVSRKTFIFGYVFVQSFLYSGDLTVNWRRVQSHCLCFYL